jgi:hypothetical protein
MGSQKLTRASVTTIRLCYGAFNMTMAEFVLQIMLLGWKPANLDDPAMQIYEFNTIHVIVIVSGANSSPSCAFVRYHKVGIGGWNRDSFPNFTKALEFLSGDDFNGS